ncbi:hypothetical protein D9M70_624120 [compost metagenome]
MPPYTLMGEKPPACAPWMTISPIMTALMRYWNAKPSATGARMATAAGPSAPKPVMTAATRNITQGIQATCPRTSLTAPSASQSIVPLICAMANR